MQPGPSSAEILSHYPGPVVLWPNLHKWQIVLVGNLVLVGLGFAMMWQGHPTGIYVVLAFGLVALLPAMVALPGAARLTIHREGFRATVLYRGRFTRWADVGEFQVAQMGQGRHRIVVYDDAGLEQGGYLMSGRSIAGRNSALPSTYGMSAEELARLLNGWRDRALREASSRG